MAALKIISEDNEKLHEGVSGTGPFSFNFAYFDDDDLNVDVDGVTIPSDKWSDTPVVVDGGYDGGTITLVDSVTVADVRIWRSTKLLRETQFGSGGATPGSLNQELNRIITMIQDNWKNLGGIVSALSAQFDSFKPAIDTVVANMSAILAAAGNAASAIVSRAGAEAARDAAIAAADGSGVSVWYNTKSLLNSALGANSDGVVAGVFADESRGGRVAIYRRETGAWVFKRYQQSLKTVYLNPASGSDANSGLQPDAPVATLSVAVGLMAIGDILLIDGGTRIHGQLNGLPNFSTVGRYGTGEDPIFDQSRPIAAASWYADGTTAGAWYADVTHEVQTVNDGVESSDTKYCMWAEWDTAGTAEADLVPYWSGVDIAANVAYIATEENVFTCHVQGSTEKDPRLDSNTTTYRYYVYPPNGEDPSAGEITYFYGEYAQVASLPEGGVARDMIWQRSSSKDTSGHNAKMAERLERIRIRGVSGHAWVGGAMLVKDCYAKARRAGEDFEGSASGWHMYLGQGFDVANIEDCEADGFLSNYYLHSSPGPLKSHRLVRIKDCISRNAAALAVNHGGGVTQGTLIDGLRSYNDAGFATLDAGSVVINSSYCGPGSGIGYSGPTGGVITVNNFLFISSGDGKLAWNEMAQALSDAAHRCTFNMSRVTNVGGKLSSSTYWRLCNYNFTDCVLGDLYIPTYFVGGVFPFPSVTADNCQMNMALKSIDELHALTGASGIDNNCVLSNVRNVMEKVVTSGMLTQVTLSSRSVSGTSASSAMTTNFADWAAVGVEFTVTDYDGAGGTHTCRITAVSGTTLTVDPAPDATFASKDFTKSIWGDKVWPAGDTGITAVFSNDGTQAYVSDASGISVGTWLWFGAIGRRSPVGPRLVTAISGQTITLDRAVDWQLLNHSGLNYATFGASGLPRPSVPVAFGFWLRGEPSGAPLYLGPKYTVTYASPLTGSASVSENPSSGGVARFAGPVGYYKADGSSGTKGQILHELGEIDAGVWPIGVGDTFRMEAICTIDEFSPEYASDPFTSGRADLVPGHYLASLGMGACLP